MSRCLGTAPARGADSAALALVLPHAGYVYSGAIAGAGVVSCAIPERAVVIAPNHTGRGAARAIHPPGEFRLPGASVPIDDELAQRCAQQAQLTFDSIAHEREHAVEVELPLLLARSPALRIAAICLSRLDYAECQAVGEGLARAVLASGGPSRVLLVASTDFSHYISAERARALDHLAIDRILALDPHGLYQVVSEQRISMCGFIPTTVTLIAALALGATRAGLVRYGNSGAASGDFSQVVGYASLSIS